MSKLFAVRIPETLITELKDLRKKKGTVISHFVSEAIKEKIIEMKEDEEDIAIIEARKNEMPMNQKEWNKLLKKRGVNV